jgi:hypothetical protein
MDGHILLGVLLGPARWLLQLFGARFVGLVLTCGWDLIYFMSLYQYGPQFLYRYLGVCHDVQIPFPAYLVGTLVLPGAISLLALWMNWVPAGDDPYSVKNPLLADALGISLPPSEGFAYRTEVWIALFCCCL